MSPIQLIASGGEGSTSGSGMTTQSTTESIERGTASALSQGIARIDPQVAACMDPVLLERYYQECASIQTRRIQEELEQMSREGADRSHQFHASIAGILYKPESSASETGFRPSKPPTYNAKDEKEWRSFINWWKVAFKKNPQAWSEKQRVADTHGKITSREQVTTIAQRRSERMTLNWDESYVGRSSKKLKRLESAMPDKEDNSSASKRRKVNKADNKGTNGITCFTCGEPGQKSPDCLTKASDNQSKADNKSKNSKAQS